jgi:hypothetical protein
MATMSPLSLRLPGPTDRTSPWSGFSAAASGNDDPGRGLGFLLHALDDHAIGERTKFHGISLMNSSQLAIDGKWALVHIDANRDQNPAP